MRLLAAALVALTSLASIAPARANEDAYFAKKRDAVEAIAAALAESKPTDKIQEEALIDLEGQLKTIVGPVSIDGLDKAGSMNPSLIYKDDVGFGHLDGLEHASSDGKLRVLASSKGLLTAWLKANPQWWKDEPDVATDLEKAFRSELFYTLAVSSDAGVSRYADLAIKKPESAELAAAMLIVRTQEAAPLAPDEIIVGVVSGGKVRIATLAHDQTFAAAEACKATWAEHESSAEVAFKAYQASELQDQAAFETYSKHLGTADKAFRACVAEKAVAEPAFATVTKIAQELAQRLSR